MGQIFLGNNLNQLRTTLQVIDQFDDAIAKLAPMLPDYALLAVAVPHFFYGKPWLNGRHKQLTNPFGPAPIIVNNAIRAVRIKLPCVHWPSSGFAFFIVAGKIVLRTTSQNI